MIGVVFAWIGLAIGLWSRFGKSRTATPELTSKSPSNQKADWITERIAEIVVVGVVAYYVTSVVSDIKSLALMVAIGFVLLGWEGEKRIRESREDQEHVKGKLNDIDRLEIELHDRMLDLQVEHKTMVSAVGLLNDRIEQASELIHEVRAAADRVEQRTASDGKQEHQPSHQERLATLRAHIAEVFHEHQEEVLKLLRENPALSLEAAIAQAFASGHEHLAEHADEEVPVVMPPLSTTHTEATIVRWLKLVGDRIEDGESLVEVETDKFTAEIPSPLAGVISRIVAQPGTVVPVSSVVCTIKVLQP